MLKRFPQEMLLGGFSHLPILHGEPAFSLASGPKVSQTDMITEKLLILFFDSTCVCVGGVCVCVGGCFSSSEFITFNSNSFTAAPVHTLDRARKAFFPISGMGSNYWICLYVFI